MLGDHGWYLISVSTNFLPYCGRSPTAWGGENSGSSIFIPTDRPGESGTSDWLLDRPRPRPRLTCDAYRREHRGQFVYRGLVSRGLGAMAPAADAEPGTGLVDPSARGPAHCEVSVGGLQVSVVRVVVRDLGALAADVLPGCAEAHGCLLPR